MKWLGRDTVRTPHMTLCLSAKEFECVARHCKVSDPGPWIDEQRQAACVHTWERKGILTCVVCLLPSALGDDPIEVAGTLVHESVHIFQSLCDSIGERNPSREFEAYSIQRISQELMTEFRRRMPK